MTDWLAHTPPEILAENFGIPVEAISKIPIHNLWIFQGKLPGHLSADLAAVKGSSVFPPYPFTLLPWVRGTDTTNEGWGGADC